MGVIKVARGTDEGMQKTAEWESEVLEKIFKKVNLLAFQIILNQHVF